MTPLIEAIRRPLRLLPTPARDRVRWRHRLLGTSIIILIATLVAAAVVAQTPFRDVESVLAEPSWGAGQGTGTRMIAFATLRPWWRKYEPDPLHRRPDSALGAVVRFDRAAVAEKQGRTQRLVPPARGIGYDALVGA